jgi:5-methylcytosine-specific restriction protein B
MDERETAVKAGSEYSLPVPDGFSWQDAFDQAKSAVINHQPVILFGPPGTGKTKMVYDLKKSLQEENRLGKFETVQFHRKFSYEDFIEGFSPSVSGAFEKRDGVFKSFSKTPSDSEVDLFVIDEINRAEITTTFGELMFLIEDRDERSVKTSHFADDFTLPANLSIIGTMNTADRNIASLDFALRRRFKFIPLFPDYDVLQTWLNQRGLSFAEFNVADYVKLVRVINRRISNNRMMGRNMQLGHAMWMPKGFDPITGEALAQLFQFEIIPQLEAYLGFGNENQLAEMLNSNVASLYLNQKVIDFKAIVGLVQDITNDNE